LTFVPTNTYVKFCYSQIIFRVVIAENWSGIHQTLCILLLTVNGCVRIGHKTSCTHPIVSKHGGKRYL